MLLSAMSGHVRVEILEYVVALQCRINHMAEAAYATGTRFWGPRACSLVFFTEVFVPCFSAGPKQCASAGPQRAQVPQKTRGPKKSAPNVFFLFPVLVFQRGAPKSPRSPENVIGPQNLKMEAPNDFFVPCFSAGSKQRGALKSPKNREAPQFKKARLQKQARKHKIFCSFFGQGAPKSDREARKS